MARFRSVAKGAGEELRTAASHWKAGKPPPLERLLVLVTKPAGFERFVWFAPDKDTAVIAEMARAALED